jgi:UDPglucose 6-dehydrogenase
MKAGWIGLGKLGYPCALALAAYGDHEVFGYDVMVSGPRLDLREAGLAGTEAAAAGRMHYMDSVSAVVRESDIVVVAVQTPHAPEFGGEQPAPRERRDFEYAYLVQAVRDVARAAQEQQRHITLAVLSTTLPGTMDRLIRPLANPYTWLVYSPAFISLGTTIANFCSPEFIICAGDGAGQGRAMLRDLYLFTKSPVLKCDFVTGELLKVSYNALITNKIVFANMIMELACKTGADADMVTKALRLGFQGGMADGGACRPRDLIALSWLSGRLDISYDLAGALASAREEQTRWLASLACSYSSQSGLPVFIMGKAYKPETGLTTGSPGLLLASLLAGREPLYHLGLEKPHRAGVFVIATRHPEYAQESWPPGSVVIDPWGYIPDRQEITVIRIGRR